MWYTLLVTTGSGQEDGTLNSVYVNLYGEYGDTGIIQLVKFQEDRNTYFTSGKVSEL